MPESRTRKSAAEKQKLKAQQASKPKKIKAPASRRWVPPTFIAVGLLGVAWLITYYVAGSVHPVHGRARQLEHPHRHGRDGRRVRARDSVAIAPRRSVRRLRTARTGSNPLFKHTLAVFRRETWLWVAVAR